MEFDNKEKKILKLIYRHPGITSEKIKKKYPDNEMFLINCCVDRYLIAQEDDNYLLFEEKPYKTTHKTKWFSTNKGNKVVEDYMYARKRELLQDYINIVLAIVAVAGLIISIISLIM